MPKRVLVTGDRNWTDKEFIRTVLKHHLRHNDILIHGDARGADRLAASAAAELGLPKDQIKAFPAQWKKYKRGAGPIRNQLMLDAGLPDIVLAFHPDLETSKGTKDMVQRALVAGLPIYLNGKIFQNSQRRFFSK